MLQKKILQVHQDIKIHNKQQNQHIGKFKYAIYKKQYQIGAPFSFVLVTKYVLKPRGCTDTGKASQNLGMVLADLPKYALT